MAYEVSLEVIINTQIEAFEVLKVHEIHVNVIDLVLLQKIYYLPIVSGASLQKLLCHSVWIEYDDHQFLFVGGGKFSRFVQDILCRFKRIFVQ